METAIKIGKKHIRVFTAETQAPLIVYHSVMNEDKALFDKKRP